MQLTKQYQKLQCKEKDEQMVLTMASHFSLDVFSFVITASTQQQ